MFICAILSVSAVSTADDDCVALDVDTLTYQMDVGIGDNVSNDSLLSVENEKNNAVNGDVKSVKKQYLSIVNSLVSKWVKGILPSYITVSNKKVSFNDYTYGLAKILSFYNENKRLPNYVIFTSKY